MSIIEKIFYHADKNPNKCAIVFNDQKYSYKNLALDIQASSQILKKKGLKKNDKVILRAANTYQFVCVYFSIHLLAGIAVLIPSEKDKIFEQLVFKSIDTKYKIENSSLFFEINQSRKSVLNLNFKIDPNKIADIVFSSGTTGEPKGVAISHRKQFLATENIIHHVKNNSNDTELILMPLSHSFGMGRLRSVLFVGGTLLIGPAIFNLKEIFHYMKEYNVNGLGLVPSAWNILRKLSRDAIIKFADQIKYIEFGSAYLGAKEKEFITKSFPGANLVMHYGLTEVSRALFINFKNDNNEAIGKLEKNVSVKIVDPSGKIVSDGKIGEILLRSSWMLDEYHDNDELSKNSFYLDHIRTGDLGKIVNGYLYLTGRLKEIINIGGKKVSPNYIEEKLNLISFIEESACIGIPHKEMGESIIAFVVIKKNQLNADGDIMSELNSKVAEIMPAFMVPEKIILIDSIPKTATGKIKRYKLTELNKDYA